MPGGGEILVILILVLLLFGPDKLPGLARQLGRGVRELNRMKSNFSEQFNLADLDDEAGHSQPTSSTRNAVSPVDSSEVSGDWQTYAASQSSDDFTRDSLTRDEDDVAADRASFDENDWRNCAEEPTVQSTVGTVPGATHSAESPAVETPTKPDAFSLNERPAPPLSVARTTPPNRVRADDETS